VPERAAARSSTLILEISTRVLGASKSKRDQSPVERLSKSNKFLFPRRWSSFARDAPIKPAPPEIAILGYLESTKTTSKLYQRYDKYHVPDWVLRPIIKGNGMRILVTGGAGFIGSHLAEKLAWNGHEVTVIDALSDFLYPRTVKEQNIKEVTRHGIEFIHANLASDNLLPLLKGQDIVINQAAIPGLEKSWTHLDQYAQSNIVGVGKLLEAAVKSNIRKFIQVSTSSVYGKDAIGKEDSPKNPFSPYGVTKLSAENLVKAYEANFGLDTTILRYFSVYGPRQRPDMAYHKFINAINRNELITIYGDGHQSRTNTYVDDIVEATIASMNLNDCHEDKIFNIAGSESWELIEVIEKIETILGKKASIKYEINRHGDQNFTKGDTTKARKFLKWEARTTIDDGLRKQIEWQINRNLN